MTDSGPNRPVYAEAGVDTAAATRALRGLLTSVKQTFAFRTGVGRPLLPIGFFANVIDLGSGLGLAISTDGVGTKILIAQLLGKYDTIGIDCVAMNVNDVICVGAEPIAMVDYVGVEVPDANLFRELGKGLLRGAELSGITIPGGELAQIPEMIRGASDGLGFDLVGTCVGLVPTDQVLSGQEIEEGDVLVGLASSGIHSNGFTLTRRVLLDSGRFKATDYIPEFSRMLGEELLEPTTIYVSLAVEALRERLPVKAFVHITGDGFLNLPRVSALVGFDVEELPDVPPIFELIQRAGDVADEEMFRQFNMGIGLCAVVPPSAVGRLQEIARSHGHTSKVIGRARSDPQKTLRIIPRGLIGRGASFSRP